MSSAETRYAGLAETRWAAIMEGEVLDMTIRRRMLILEQRIGAPRASELREIARENVVGSRSGR